MRTSRPRCSTRAPKAATDSGAPVTTSWPGAVCTAIQSCGNPAASSANSSSASSTTAIAPGVSPASNRDRCVMTRTPSAGVSAPATTAAATSPIEWPRTAAGRSPYERHRAASATCRPKVSGWATAIRWSAGSRRPSRRLTPLSARKSGSSSSTAAAKAGSVSSSRRPIAGQCAP